jgi:hypothetical protein
MYWLLIGIIVLALILLLWMNRDSMTEGFTTIDIDTAKAQRQQLQFEGERRYNDLGRLQTPGTAFSPDLVDAAVSQPLALPGKNTTSLLTLVNSSIGLGGGAIASRGSGVEQTGAIMEKIKFCESLPLDCSSLDDPRLAECGMCHRDGKDSTGKAHRGGMYISADDIIRANTAAEGGPASYQPTVGSCKPQNFTLMKDNCSIREMQLQCQSAGAATTANQCGQCYGAAPAGATGLVFVGPKPRAFTAVLVLSHPGMHNYQGTGTIITLADGSTINVPYSERYTLDPQKVYLTVTEGDTIGIKIFGVPMVWCAWLSSPDGNRSVSIDIGLQNEAANPGMVIAGDKRSAAVTKAASTYDGDIWATFQQQVPNTVMWYARRDEVLHGGITSAFYGDANNVGAMVGPALKGLAGAYTDIWVQPATFGIADPSPGNPKMLKISLDNGSSFNVVDGTIIPKDRLNNSANLMVTVPATLVDPAFPDDKADCPTGPIVFTEVGAGLMGSHSCFKPDGSFNPTQYCLQELFLAAGGTQSGTGYPNTDAKAAALVKNNNLDDTTAYLNNMGSIAQYGVDTNGNTVPFSSTDPSVMTIQSAAQLMLGITMTNPCDGPNANTGPQTPECMDFLYRTAGLPSLPAADSDPSSFTACVKGGPYAPLRADGSVNEDVVSFMNQSWKSVSGIRQVYTQMFNQTKDSSNFTQQNSAMQICLGTSVKPPAPPPLTCVPEVFNICPVVDGTGYSVLPDEAEAVCKAAGAQVATPAQIQDAHSRGANWCACGWATDSVSYYPMNKILPEYQSGCGSVQVNSCGTAPSWSNGKACATCYGVKPPQNNAPGVLPFNTDTRTATYSMTSPGYDETDGADGQICFDGLTVAQAQAACSADSTCMSFSFTADNGQPTSIGGGCYKRNHNAPYNSNPAYVGFNKQSPPPALIIWNDPKIPRVGQMTTLQNAANPSGVVATVGNTLIIADPSTITPQSGTFNVLAANNGTPGYVSFQLTTDPTIFIRHSNFIGYTMPKDGGDLFNNDSSFIVLPALNNNPNMFSLQSANYLTRYLMTATNPDGSVQVVLREPGSAIDNASWSGVLPLVAQAT